jgi:hypothetical protein
MTKFYHFDGQNNPLLSQTPSAIGHYHPIEMVFDWNSGLKLLPSSCHTGGKWNHACVKSNLDTFEMVFD